MASLTKDRNVSNTRKGIAFLIQAAAPRFARN